MSSNLVIGIASTGRAEVLAGTVARLVAQTRTPDRVILSVTCERDVDADTLAHVPLPIEVHFSAPGLTRQRNAILTLVAPEDIVVFIDDDFLPAEDYIATVCDLFKRHPVVAMVTGRVLADGILGPGITFEQAETCIRRGRARIEGAVHSVYNGYGCNMAIRARPVLAHDLRFDERLPMYGWLEDVDFSRQIARHGLVVMCPGMTGVHLGTKAARSPGARLGYSQVANPLYLASKGTMARHRAFAIMSRNLLMNLLRFWVPEPWVDRRGRLRGNLLAMRDLLTGQLCPERAGLIE
ncbi:MAG: glycosyltransferase [Rhodobacteraceae bacterium]|nr:glycosyltransferase [Paracoccaceae bacterium]TVR46253.1 MAG: glycosyltransferase [Paracoccaceae bacterium]